jgi:hypothetical protein
MLPLPVGLVVLLVRAVQIITSIDFVIKIAWFHKDIRFNLV